MEKDPVVLQIQEKLNPYVERIQELETSVSKKDEEIIILRLAVERLMDIKKSLSHKKGKKTGGAGKGKNHRGGKRGAHRGRR